MRIAIYGLRAIAALAACVAMARQEGHEVVVSDEVPTPETAEPADAVVCQLGPSAGAVATAYAGTDTPIYGQALDEDPALFRDSGGFVAFAQAIGAPLSEPPA